MRIRMIAALLILCFVCSCASGGADHNAGYWESKGLTGKWEGRAGVALPWITQDSLAVFIEIHPDGGVVGKIGDALINDGLISRGRGWMEKSIRVGSDYVVSGRLAGNIVECDGIHRQSVEIRLDFRDGQLKGEVETSGFEFGGGDRMVLRASNLVLSKPVS